MHRRAFTLTEMLAVIAIISALIGLSLPAIGSVRQAAQTTLCQAKTKSLATAMAAYENSTGRFPPMFTAFKYYDSNPRALSAPSPQPQNFWFDIIDQKTFCPSRKVPPAAKNNPALSNYGTNATLCPPTINIAPQKTIQLKTPSQVFLLADAGYAGLSWQNASTNAAPPITLATSYIPGLKTNAKRILRSDTKIDAIKGRHAKTMVNTVFADLHTQPLPANSFAVPQNLSPSQIWNCR